MSKQTKTLHGPGGIRINLDRDEVFPDDPGQGTPAMVNLFSASSTFTYACNEGELDDGKRGMRKLTPEQCQWLNDQENAVEEFLYRND